MVNVWCIAFGVEGWIFCIFRTIKIQATRRKEKARAADVLSLEKSRVMRDAEQNETARPTRSEIARVTSISESTLTYSN